MIKVIAKQRGEYPQGVVREIGAVFEVKEEHFADVNSPDPKVGPFGWMEKYVAPPPPPVQEPVKPAITAPVAHDRRSEERDPGEHEQHVAKGKGLPTL